MNDQSTINGNGEDDPDLPTPKIPNYELVKLIGQGSFGQVWIALDATNSPCALKIIHKRRTKEELFWKEFKGVQNYLPISRSNLGLVTILHVGVSENESFFYYTMELADNIHGDSQEKDWSSYEAKSLSSQIRSSAAPCPLDQFHQISQNLTNGLAHLHKKGLVHRDIKPSNVIFVNGSAKLADVGLVTLREDASTFIGTTGYIPPEGPGTPAGDVYALGKTLYEVFTGNSVQSFPSLPTLVGGTHPEEKLFAAFNLVISQACTPNYLERIKDGQSFQKALSEANNTPSIPRKNTKVLKKYFAIATLALVIGFFGYDFKLNNSDYTKFLRGELKNGFQTIRSLPELLESKLLTENEDGFIFGAEDPEQNSSEIANSNIPKKLDDKNIEQERYLPRQKPEELKLTEQSSGTSERLVNEKLESNTHVVEVLPNFKKSSRTEASTSPQPPLAELPANVTHEIVPSKNLPLQRQPVPQITERFLEPIKQKPVGLIPENIPASSDDLIGENSIARDSKSKSHESPQTNAPKVSTPKKPNPNPTIGSPFVWEEMKLTMPWVPPGECLMHTRNGMKINKSFPQTIKFSSGFWMSKFEITQFTFFKVMKKNPASNRKQSNLPVENVSFNNALDFCKKLTDIAREKKAIDSDYLFSLPFETDWEYACKAGSNSKFSWGKNLSTSHANFRNPNHRSGKTMPVGSFHPNKWGFHDMHGNISEWCQTSTKIAFDSDRSLTVALGGAFNNTSDLCSAEHRSFYNKSEKWHNLGFRICLKKIINY
jgi:formylglycine-generating enzyme required for sulfatase activity